MVMKRVLVLAVLGIVLAVCAGCATVMPVLAISLHEYSAEGDPSTTRFNISALEPGATRSKTTMRRAFVDARHFKYGEVIADRKHPGRYGVRLEADSFGTNRLMQVAGGHDQMRIAVVVDGFYVGDARLDERKAFEGIVELPGLWGKAEAEAIAENVASNYKKIDRNN